MSEGKKKKITSQQSLDCGPPRPSRFAKKHDTPSSLRGDSEAQSLRNLRTMAIKLAVAKKGQALSARPRRDAARLYGQRTGKRGGGKGDGKSGVVSLAALSQGVLHLREKEKNGYPRMREEKERDTRKSHDASGGYEKKGRGSCSNGTQQKIIFRLTPSNQVVSWEAAFSWGGTKKTQRDVK